MKKFITRLLACLFTVLFLISCTKEEPLQMDTVQETQQSGVIVEQVDFNSIPELSQALNDVSGKSRLARSYAEKGDSKFWIDEEDVLKLKDSVNNESYSIIIHTDEPTPTSFYNLVVTKRTNGNPIIPFVVEYKFENGDIFSFAEDEEKKFDGTVNIYSLREFANATGLNARNTGAVACFQDVGQRNHTVVGNNSSGSTGGSPSGGTSTTGSPNTSGTVSVTRPHISVSRARSRGSVSVGQGTFYMPPLTSDKKTQKRGAVSKDESNECPEGYVSIPINVTQNILYPDCASFEFANGLRGSVKGAQVLGVTNTFIAYERVSPSITNVNVINILYPDLFFTMPAGWTNGRAATLAAKALQVSITITESWYRANPKATEAQLQIQWRKNMSLQMGYRGGSVSTRPLFPVRSPAPYKRRFFGTGYCG